MDQDKCNAEINIQGQRFVCKLPIHDEGFHSAHQTAIDENERVLTAEIKWLKIVPE